MLLRILSQNSSPIFTFRPCVRLYIRPWTNVLRAEHLCLYRYTFLVELLGKSSPFCTAVNAKFAQFTRSSLSYKCSVVLLLSCLSCYCYHYCPHKSTLIMMPMTMINIPFSSSTMMMMRKMIIIMLMMITLVRMIILQPSLSLSPHIHTYRMIILQPSLSLSPHIPPQPKTCNAMIIIWRPRKKTV